MNDQSLIELAAKAYQHDNAAWHDEDKAAFRRGFMDIWNPLHNDTHALRLAAHLDLDIMFFPGFGEVQVSDQKLDVETSESTSGDKMAAVRRAIVRAAALLGEKM
jgi:hypothetical protein